MRVYLNKSQSLTWLSWMYHFYSIEVYYRQIWLGFWERPTFNGAAASCTWIVLQIWPNITNAPSVIVWGGCWVFQDAVTLWSALMQLCVCAFAAGYAAELHLLWCNNSASRCPTHLYWLPTADNPFSNLSRGFPVKLWVLHRISLATSLPNSS